MVLNSWYVNGPEEALLFLALPGQGKFILLLCKSLKKASPEQPATPCSLPLNVPFIQVALLCWELVQQLVLLLTSRSLFTTRRKREASEPSLYGKSGRTRNSQISKTNLFPSIKLSSLNILCHQLIPAFCLRQPSLSLYWSKRDLRRHLNSHSAVSPVSAHSYILQRKTWPLSSPPLPLPGNSFPVPFTLLHNKGRGKMFQCYNASRIRREERAGIS